MGGLGSLSRKKITVCVEHPATKKTHQETVPGDLTVWELKKKISKIFKIQAENQILAADQGRIMANDKTQTPGVVIFSPNSLLNGVLLWS